jgi:hypothetical protein
MGALALLIGEISKKTLDTLLIDRLNTEVLVLEPLTEGGDQIQFY